MNTILIATDGQAWSREAIHQFLESSCFGEVTLHVMSVVAPPEAGRDRDERFSEAIATADGALDTATLDMKFGGRTVHAFTRVGDPVSEIVKAAEELAANLVVLGTRGPEGLTAGHSVAEEVLHQVSCGVLIFPMRHAAVVG